MTSQSFRTPKWAIVDKSTNKKIETYRQKSTAITNISRLKKIYVGSKLEIQELNV